MTVSTQASFPSQLVVIVTIVGVDEFSQVFYTYTDNQENAVHVDVTQSTVIAVPPYHTLYVLDYASSRNGWLFLPDVVPNPVTGPSTVFSLIESSLGLITKHEAGPRHNFKLHFLNRFTAKDIWDDPQEANVKQPTNP